MQKIYVIYSDNVGCPGDVIDSDIVIEANIDIQEKEEAENDKGLRYAHWYEEKDTEYGFQYHYLSTTNA
ncbi:hypothetical protein KM908_14050 [Alkalihalobacillus clausii]|uniref:Uncharacterized protein n=1 Tax=Shouchella clausii TaxID=79880 RepID=A0A268RW05_SHOCL|nr:hypothetical protein [Shouchella clausii]MBU8597265.1 hypothetical protein [Shouchella clausii]PAF24387.1 hypothetical protein CHH61_19015 [Shouchella clausii]